MVRGPEEEVPRAFPGCPARGGLLSRTFGPLDAAQTASIASWIDRLRQPGFHWTAQQYKDAVHGRGVFGELSGTPRAAILWADVGPNVEILVLMTHPDHQRQGLMRELGPEFFKHFTGLKEEVWLEVHAANAPARALYDAWGFTQVGERPHYYGPGQSAILMTKALPTP